jgi:transposase
LYDTASHGDGETRARSTAGDVGGDDRAADVGHPFYARLGQLLRDASVDDFAEARCASFDAATMGRPGLAPGIYFRLLLVGYFEGPDSERAIAWRAADSLTLRDFPGLAFPEAPADHSTIARTGRLIDRETHRDIFTWMLERLGEAGLVQGKTVAIDATTLEANGAWRSIVRRDTGESYRAFLTTLAHASGIENPTRADLARLDRKRKKKGSNKDWTSPSDPDAQITRMKDGRTHLAHEAEHAVDLDTGAIVAVSIHGADAGDTQTLPDTLAEAVEQLDRVKHADGDPVALADEVVADKGCHSRAVVLELTTHGSRTYITEPDRGAQSWVDHDAARAAVYGGGMRRTHLRGHVNILKRVLVHASGFNPGLVMRRLIGAGTPRGLQGRLRAVIACAVASGV